MNISGIITALQSFNKLTYLLNTVNTLTHHPSEFSSKKNPFPCPTTFRTALTHYVDICTPPRSNVIKDLAQYATDENEKAFLLKLSSNEGKVRFIEKLLIISSLEL